jgi:hypothetical protein
VSSLGPFGKQDEHCCSALEKCDFSGRGMSGDPVSDGVLPGSVGSLAGGTLARESPVLELWIRAVRKSRFLCMRRSPMTTTRLMRHMPEGRVAKVRDANALLLNEKVLTAAEEALLMRERRLICGRSRRSREERTVDCKRSSAGLHTYRPCLLIQRRHIHARAPATSPKPI